MVVLGLGVVTAHLVWLALPAPILAHTDGADHDVDAVINHAGGCVAT